MSENKATRLAPFVDLYDERFERASSVTYHNRPPPPMLPEWAAEMHFNQHAMGHPFCVLVFVGPVPENPEEWLQSPSFVDMATAYVQHSPAPPLEIRGCADLNPALLKHPELGSLRPEVVVPYLRRELSWRVDWGPIEEVETLEVVVSHTPMSPPRPGELLPVSGTPVYHPEVTHGRQGGHGWPADPAARFNWGE